MKKFIVFLLMFGAILFTGCSDSGGNDFMEKSYTAKGEELSGVSIDVRDREIEVTLSNDNQVHIQYFENNKEAYNFSVSDDKLLSMTAVYSKEWTDYFGKKAAAKHRKIYLQVPNELLSTLSLSTTNENISLCALSVTDSISVLINGGNIIFDQLDAGNSLTLTAKNGDIRGTIASSYDDFAIDCDIKKGESNLPSKKEGGEKDLRVSNNNGDIDVQFVQE